MARLAEIVAIKKKYKVGAWAVPLGQYSAWCRGTVGAARLAADECLGCLPDQQQSCIFGLSPAHPSHRFLFWFPAHLALVFPPCSATCTWMRPTASVPWALAGAACASTLGWTLQTSTS